MRNGKKTGKNFKHRKFGSKTAASDYVDKKFADQKEEAQMEPDEELKNGAPGQEEEQAPEEQSMAEGQAEDLTKDEAKAAPEEDDSASKEVEELKKLVAEKADRLTRTMAEFDNYRKRTEKEKDARFGMGERSVIERILPVIDNFERGLATIDDAAREDPFVKGMDQVYKQLTGVLADMGVKEIPALGETFNPDLHNAVMHVDDDNYKESEIVEVFSKGYSYKGNVVRFSMVKVAN